MLREDIDDFLKTIPVNVVAATKYVGPEEMKDLLAHGVNNFGENRVEAFLNKYEALKDYKDIRWHFIGLHSLDSLELAKMIEKYREEPLDTFIEVSINLEENKNGVDFHNIDEFMKEILKYKKINVVGFMMMAIKADSHEDLLKQFKSLKYLKERVEKDFNISMPYLSMGMSEDYKEAIEAGSTHVRLGRVLWKM